MLSRCLLFQSVCIRQAPAAHWVQRHSQGLAEIPPEPKWCTNSQNPCTREAYQLDPQDFVRFTERAHPEALRRITRARLSVWHDSFTRRDSCDQCRLTSSPNGINYHAVADRCFMGRSGRHLDVGG
jgi:hypothetical protein